MSETSKQCSYCKNIKPLESFYRYAVGRLGRQSRCKVCQKATYGVYIRTEARRTRWQEYRSDPDFRERRASAERANRTELRFQQREYRATPRAKLLIAVARALSEIKARPGKPRSNLLRSRVEDCRSLLRRLGRDGHG